MVVVMTTSAATFLQCTCCWRAAHQQPYAGSSIVLPACLHSLEREAVCHQTRFFVLLPAYYDLFLIKSDFPFVEIFFISIKAKSETRERVSSGRIGTILWHKIVHFNPFLESGILWFHMSLVNGFIKQIPRIVQSKQGVNPAFGRVCF